MAVRGSVLLYNFKDKERTDKVKFIFVLMGIKIKTVEKTDYLQKIGALAGVEGIGRTEEIYEGEGFDEEMLVINHLTDSQMNRMLAYLKKEGIKIPLKAALTPTNANWNTLELHKELVREHEEMQKMMAAQKAGRKEEENRNDAR